MHRQVEVMGQYRVELSAMQLIENGGWTAYAAVRPVEEEANTAADVIPSGRLLDEAVFESEKAALAAARRVAIALLKAGNGVV